jgi:hypothetical protein
MIWMKRCEITKERWQISMAMYDVHAGIKILYDLISLKVIMYKLVFFRGAVRTYQS